MYLIYAPEKKFNKLPPRTPLITDEVRFTNNVAYCTKFFWRKHHLLQGCRDISPHWMVKMRQRRTLNKILVIATGGFGDVMWSMPFVRSLREKYPRSKIFIATEERSMPIWLAFPYADLCVKDEFWNMQNLVRESDEVYDFGGIATILKKEMRLDPVEATFKLGELPLPKDKKLCRPHLVVTLDEGKKMQAALKRHGIDVNSDKIITIALESSTPNRNWPFLYVRKLSEMLTGDGFKVLWLSESKDFGDTYFFGCGCGYEFNITVKEAPETLTWTCPSCHKENILSEFKHPDGVVNLGGKTSIREAMAAIAFSDAFIGPNSGLMVVATSLEIPTVGLFGAFNPRLRAKFYEKFTPLWGKVPCAPCNEHWTECSQGYPAPCMKVITIKEVHEAVTQLINRYPRSIVGKLPIE